MISLKKSVEYYQRSKKILAGPSTFSKGPDMFADGITPFAISHGKNGHIWDVDNNKYIDLTMALGSVFLGYCHPYIEEAIKDQLHKGITFSLTHEKEIEVAEMLCERIPCAEMVRFGKNGNDVTSAAVRLARFVTGKNNVLFCGYHAWQDWYVCQTSMNGGIPEEIKKYSHRFSYNDIEQLKKIIEELKDDVACIIMEPISKFPPKENYLSEIRKLANERNIILIFDEVVTGFRMHRGGYQSICGITPDLACFSKALANGMPISALVGKENIMRECTKIFFSLTFAGEALSLSAAKASMEFIDQNDVINVVNKKGEYLEKNLNTILKKAQLDDMIEIIGYPTKQILLIKDEVIRTFIIQELIKNSILTNGGNTLCYSHTQNDLDYIIKIYDKTINDLKKFLDDKTLPEKIDGKIIRQSISNR